MPALGILFEVLPSRNLDMIPDLLLQVSRFKSMQKLTNQRTPFNEKMKSLRSHLSTKIMEECFKISKNNPCVLAGYSQRQRQVI